MLRIIPWKYGKLLCCKSYGSPENWWFLFKMAGLKLDDCGCAACWYHGGIIGLMDSFVCKTVLRVFIGEELSFRIWPVQSVLLLWSLWKGWVGWESHWSCWKPKTSDRWKSGERSSPFGFFLQWLRLRTNSRRGSYSISCRDFVQHSSG